MNATAKATVTPPKAKNECAKMRPKENPYEVWQAGDWTWRVLKKYQSRENEALNPNARWFCLVITPMTGKYGDMGDVYIREILNAGAVKIA
jgi:hypothetical protein